MKVVVSEMGELVICCRKIRRAMGMAQYLPIRSLYGILGHPRHMRPSICHGGTVQPCHYSMILLLQCLLYMFQLLRVQTCSNSLVRWQYLSTVHQIQSLILRRHRGGLVSWITVLRSDNRYLARLGVSYRTHWWSTLSNMSRLPCLESDENQVVICCYLLASDSEWGRHLVSLYTFLMRYRCRLTALSET